MEVLKKSFKVKDKHVGIGAINPFGMNMAASRGNMGNTQLGKYIPAEGIKPPIILTGHEKKYVDALKQIKVEGEVIVLDRVDKKMNGFLIETYIFFMDENNVVDVVVVPKYETLDNKILFEHKYTDVLDNIEIGETLVDPVFSNTPSNVDGYNSFGIPLDVVFANINEIGEDAIIVNESTMEKFAFYTTKELTLSMGKGEYFKNLYGDDNVWKGLPDVGEYVNEDGVLYDLLKLDIKTEGNNKSIDYTTIDNLRKDLSKEPSPLDDNLVYGKGMVYDIEVITPSKRKKSDLIVNKLDRQIEYYSNMFIDHKKDLVDTYINICKEWGKGVYDTNLKFSPEVSVLIEDAFTYHVPINAYNFKSGVLPIERVGKTGKAIRETLIKIKLRHKVIPGKGYKLSDMFGAKGIVGLVLPDKDMPCDCILNPLATSDRTIPGRLMESYLSGLTRDVRETSLSLLDGYSKQGVNKAKDYIVGYYNIVSPKLAKGLSKYNDKDTIDFLRDLENNDLHVHKRFEDDTFLTMYEELESSVYAKKKFEGKVKMPDGTVIDLTGRTIGGTLYTTLLNNLPTAAIATDKPRVNSIGIPPSASKEVKNKYPYNVQATRILSEPETKIVLSYCDPRLIAELRDRMGSTTRQREQCRGILKVTDPANIDVLLDRKKYPYIGGIGTQMINSIYATGGLKLSHTKLEGKEV